jgi:probable addiction module antidote protein
MEQLNLRKWDSAEHLRTAEDMALYLEACIEEAGDDVARAHGMTQLSKETGLGRESLYKALSGEANPSFDTILKVAKALGLQLHFQSLTAKP